MRIYVASSWRCPTQPGVVRVLRTFGFDCYDFRHPTTVESDGFHWSEVLPSYERGSNGLCDPTDYLMALQQPAAVQGFGRDFDAMQECDTCVLVLPCGRSAHLELGWFVGQGRRTAILLDGPQVTPELMYKMVDCVTTDMNELVDWLFT